MKLAVNNIEESGNFLTLNFFIKLLFNILFITVIQTIDKAKLPET